jgi:hypothetical protein
MKVRTTALALFLAVFAHARDARAQQVVTSVPPARNLPATINVFLDCDFFCDFDFIRTEVPYVNWMRDRTDADVHVLVTQQNTGGGGSEYTLAFLGSRGFSAASDTLKYVSTVDATRDDTRKGITRTIKIGLVRYVARTSSADRLLITFGPAANKTSAPETPQHDPWRAWVMSLSAYGSLSGEKRSKYMFGNENFSANRTTEAFKSGLGVDFSYNESDYVGKDSAGVNDSTFRSIQRDWGINTSQIKSLTQHWSAGLTGSLGSNSYINEARYIKGQGAVEYDLFPYSESTRRQLRFQYGAGLVHYGYTEETIYFKTSETVPIHYFSMSYSTVQPWGSSGASILHNALIKDASKRSTRINANTNVRIFKGFSVFMSGGYSWIHDQLYLAKGEDVTTNDVVLRQQQLKTSYRYNAYVGLNYTFGSIFNNIVNPRFGNGNLF